MLPDRLILGHIPSSHGGPHGGLHHAHQHAAELGQRVQHVAPPTGGDVKVSSPSAGRGTTSGVPHIHPERLPEEHNCPSQGKKVPGSNPTIDQNLHSFFDCNHFNGLLSGVLVLTQHLNVLIFIPA
jgi:hypothetical protein